VKFTTDKVIYWIVLYFLLSLFPLAIALIGPLPPPRGFLVEFGVALGFIGMAGMALQFLTSGRLAKIAPSYGSDVVLQYHRQMGIAAFFLVLLHPIILIITDPVYLEYFDPRVNFLRAVALSVVVVLLIAVIVTSIWRQPVGLNYEWWRVLHGFFSLGIVFIGMVHGLQVSHYLDPFWKKAIWTAPLLGIMYLVVHTRVVRPWLSRRKPYRVLEVQEERGDSWTLKLAPEGHPGMKYKAGQYIWITVGDTPFKLQQHPFSFSSSALHPEIWITAKALGDFTSTFKEIKPDTLAYLEGPFGAFTLEPDAAGPFIIVGGIGVTPALSILRTMRDTKDSRPAILLYGNSTLEDVTFLEDLQQLSKEIKLQVIHVLEDPPEGWEGETGYITEEMLEKYLPFEKLGYEYFICGPEPLMDTAETGLRKLGVPWQRIYTERFQIV
jgi:predicted ferric reductase